jgi:hypothetical protein
MRKQTQITQIRHEPSYKQHNAGLNATKARNVHSKDKQMLLISYIQFKYT